MSTRSFISDMARADCISGTATRTMSQPAAFSASVSAFVDARDADDALIARAWLEDDDGRRLATLKRPCPPRGGEIGILECALPNNACVLTLCASLSKGAEIIEQSQIPVYVGVNGMLEAAF